MRRPDARHVRSIVGLCLPTAVVALGCLYFFIAHVPEIIRNEHRRVQAEYRELAREIKADPAVGFRTPRGKGAAWVKDRRMAPGYWGIVEGPDFGCPSLGEAPSGKVLVWFVDDKDVCRARWADRIAEVDFRLIFQVCGSLLLLVLVGVTLVGVRYFVRYAKEREDFLAATAHDLTTPLVGLRLTVGRDDAEAKRLVEQMLRLVGNLKDFLQLGGRRPAPRRERVDLTSAYRSAYALFEADYRDLFDGADVACAGVEELPAVRADETLVVQIFWNLLANELKYAAPYGPVSVAFSVADGFVSVAFRDVGPGMTPRQRRRAFDRYYRAKTALKSGKGGFGIGLCTAREFARAMGGELTVAANSPQGCVFTVRLPIWS